MDDASSQKWSAERRPASNLSGGSEELRNQDERADVKRPDSQTRADSAEKAAPDEIAYSYDESGRLLSRTSSSDVGQTSTNYIYDPAGNLTGVEMEGLYGKTEHVFVYDTQAGSHSEAYAPGSQRITQPLPEGFRPVRRLQPPSNEPESRRPATVNIVAEKVTSSELVVVQMLEPFSAEGDTAFTVEQGLLSEAKDCVNVGAIVPGSLGDSPYLILKCPAGPNIQEYSDLYCLEMERRLALFAKLCECIERLHDRGLTVTDLNVDNVIIRPDADPPVPCFARTRIVPQSTDLMCGLGLSDLFGFENAPASRLQIQRDVCSLGHILYALVVGTPPELAKQQFNENRIDVSHAINDDIPSPVDFIGMLPKDPVCNLLRLRRTNRESLLDLLRSGLNDVVEKTLRFTGERFGSVKELGDAISVLLSKEPPSKIMAHLFSGDPIYANDDDSLEAIFDENNAPLTSAMERQVALVLEIAEKLSAPLDWNFYRHVPWFPQADAMLRVSVDYRRRILFGYLAEFVCAGTVFAVMDVSIRLAKSVLRIRRDLEACKDRSVSKAIAVVLKDFEIAESIIDRYIVEDS